MLFISYLSFSYFFMFAKYSYGNLQRPFLFSIYFLVLFVPMVHVIVKTIKLLVKCLQKIQLIQSINIINLFIVKACTCGYGFVALLNCQAGDWTLFSGSPINKQKLANQVLRGKEVGVAETSLTRVSDGQNYRQYVFDALKAWACYENELMNVWIKLKSLYLLY